MRPAAPGFTLVELLVVLVVLALVLAALPQVLSGSSSRAEFRLAARDIASGLRATRAQAIASGRSQTFTLDVETRAFRAGERGAPRALPRNLALELETAAEELAGDAQGRIRFFPDGSSTGGRIVIAGGAASAIVEVNFLTGRVTLRE